ncbi:MAG: hypothetical protein GY943_15410 [Chloroflexi bacterium]|nr:hypothetical protein [Chloroflexota bacterium]
MKYLNQRFLKDFQLAIIGILTFVVPLLLILSPLWWWSRSLLFVGNLFRSLTGRAIAVIVFTMILGAVLAFYAKDPEFFSNQPSWKRNPPSRFPKIAKGNILLFFTFSMILYLLFLFFFLSEIFIPPSPSWREAYVIAVISLFPFYIGTPVGLFIGTFIWFWLYVLKFVFYGLRGELEEI